MKKSLLGLSLVAATVLVGTMASVNVDAASSEKTEVGIGFSKYGTGTGPFKNNLNIAYYPNAFNFQNGNDITGKSFQATNQDHYVGVFDDRTDATIKNQGWKLTAVMSKLTNGGKDAELKELNGKVILGFDAPQQVNKAAIKDTADGKDYILPAANTADKTAIADVAKYNFTEISKPLELEAGSAAAVTVMGATNQVADTAAGRGLITAHTNDVKMVVSNPTAETNYKGNITWKLESTY